MMDRFFILLRFPRAFIAACALVQLMAMQSFAHEVKSRGQTVYLPIYSTIAHWSPRNMDLTVTLSIRNVDPEHPITLKLIDYIDTAGRKKKSLLAKPKLIAPYGSTQLIIPREDFPGDVGANAIVTWEAAAPLTPPLIESIMIGSDGTQAYSFSSRGVVIE
jgi:hypothetical protein